jgi:Zn-dependent membrane protease YugP
MANKILGYILLAIGLMLIGGTIFQSYNIFTDKVSAPLVFKTETPSQTSTGATSVEKQINEQVQKQLNQVLPAATITKILNLIAWSMLAFILVTAGGAIASIGVKLTK